MKISKSASLWYTKSSKKSNSNLSIVLFLPVIVIVSLCSILVTSTCVSSVASAHCSNNSGKVLPTALNKTSAVWSINIYDGFMVC